MMDHAVHRGLDVQLRGRSMSAPIGVFIVSRNRLFADALASLLGKSGELAVTGTAPEPAPAALASDVLLIDADGRPGDGAAIAALACLRGAGCRPIVVGVPREDDELVGLIEAGAQGYVLAGTSPDDLIATIRAVHAGRGSCSPRLAAAIVDRILELERRRVEVDRRPGEPLTPREREVLAWMATGRGNKEIARRLGISVQTVKNHVHSILTKLGAGRRREALRRAYELGLLGDQGDAPPAGDGGPAGGSAG